MSAQANGSAVGVSPALSWKPALGHGLAKTTASFRGTPVRHNGDNAAMPSHNLGTDDSTKSTSAQVCGI